MMYILLSYFIIILITSEAIKRLNFEEDKKYFYGGLLRGLITALYIIYFIYTKSQSPNTTETQDPSLVKNESFSNASAISGGSLLSEF